MYTLVTFFLLDYPGAAPLSFSIPLAFFKGAEKIVHVFPQTTLAFEGFPEKGRKKLAENNGKVVSKTKMCTAFVLAEMSARVSETGFSAKKGLKMARNDPKMFFP